MGNPYLESDESIVLSTHNVIVKSARSEVILTNQRLIFSESGYTVFRPRTIPLAVIMTVTEAETATGDPIINLSLATSDGATQPLELVFTRKPREQRKQECDAWVQKLGELTVAARDDAARMGISIADLVAKITIDATPRATPQEGAPVEQPVMTGGKKSSSGSCRRSFPKTSSAGPKIIAIAAIIIVIIAVLVGAYINAKSLPGTSGVPAVPTATPVTTVTPAATPVPTPLPTVTILQTPTPVLTTVPPSPPQIVIPPTGVWVRVEYPENAGIYAGSVGTTGRQKQVNATGAQFYQIPAAQSDIMDISVQKQSGSGEMLTVKVYNNGELVKIGRTSKPLGTIVMHFDLKTALPISSSS